jgi:hypothetical protein
VVADHIALGTGDLPLDWLLARLERAAFAGPLILELSVDEAVASLRKVQSIRPASSQFGA